MEDYIAVCILDRRLSWLKLSGSAAQRTRAGVRRGGLQV